jgi:hypothetical protein
MTYSDTYLKHEISELNRRVDALIQRVADLEDARPAPTPPPAKVTIRPSWCVFDRVTDAQVSKWFSAEHHARDICREFNRISPGGRYGIREGAASS